MTVEMKKYKLGEVLEEFHSGNSIKAADIKDVGKYPVFGANGLRGYTDRYNCDGDVAIIGRQGAYCGNVKFFSGKAYYTEHAVIAKPRKGFDAKYLACKLPFYQLEKYQGQSAQPGLSVGTLSLIDIELPSYENQRSVASVLQTLDKRIENLRAQNRVLEQTAKTIYDYTFLQCAGHQTTYNKTLNRNIPADWEIDNLYRIADFTNGLACQKYRPITEKEKLPVIKIREMHDGVTADTEFVRSDIPEKVIVNPGDLLFSWSASLEVMMWNGVKGGLNQHIFKVTPKEYFSLYFVYFQLKDYIGNFKRMAEARKTTMGHITTDHLNQSRIAIPDEETMKRFSSQVTPLFKKQLVNSQQIETLTTQRNTLLPLLMTGQVEVM